MKTFLLFGDGSNHKALAHRLAAAVPLSGIAAIRLSPPRKRRKLGPRIVSALLARPLRRAWFGMMQHYQRAYPEFPGVQISEHESVNAASVQDLMERERPGLVLVSGTDLLKAPLIDVIGRSGRIMNLHTGLSPYLKGGPNCTNWALALGEFDLIGNTIMWLDAGIDSGHIIASETTPLTGEESLLELHVAVMDHAHSLYVRCARRFANGLQLPSVPQSDIGTGRLFFTRDWTGAAMLKAMFNFYLHYGPAALRTSRPLTLVAPDSPQAI